VKRAFAALLLGGCQVLFPLTAAPPDTPPGDRDADGVLDDDDNCPDRANVDQHDEDGDAVGDPCDNCPHVDNRSQDEDGDGDHLGGSCDDSAFTDCIVHFDPFVTMVPTDTTTVGTWTVIEKALHQNSLMQNGYLLLDVTPRTNPLIVVGARVLELGPIDDFSNHGIWFSEIEQFEDEGVPLTGFVAEITSTITLNPPTTAAIHLADPPISYGHELLSPDVNLSANTVTEIRLDLRGFGVTARGEITGLANRTVLGAASIGPGFVALRTFQQKVAFDYALVIERVEGSCPPR
jgi:hypothetical protein